MTRRTRSFQHATDQRSRRRPYRCFVSEGTPGYEQAVQALQTLDPDLITRVFAEVYSEYALQAVLGPNGKLSNPACVHRLRGKRCPGYGVSGGCLPAGSDHARLILKSGRPYALLIEPYGISDEHLRSMTTWRDKHNRQMTIDARRATWFPSQTTPVIFRPNEAVEAERAEWKAQWNAGKNAPASIVAAGECAAEEIRQ